MRRAVRRIAPWLAGAAAIGSAAAAPQERVVLGVSTHFDQGMPFALLDQVKAVHAPSIRDSVTWDKSEPKPGVYDFSELHVGYVRRACQAGSDVLLVIDPRSSVYDNGDTPHSPAAQKAFGTYLARLVDQFPKGCVAGIEVGNELNADAGMKLPAGMDRVTTYVALLRAVHAALRPSHPEVAIVGGSTNVIGTGFIESLAAAGALDVMDAVAIHPYRAFAEGVDVELERVTAAMARHGAVKPIWATEFGNYFTAPEQAPPLLVKMTMMLAAAGIPRSYWYALQDESYYPNMGLYDPQVRAKPAADAFRFTTDVLLAGGKPVRVDAGDRRTFVFALASGGHVLWGDPRPITVTGTKAARDAHGRPIAIPAMLSDDPIYLSADAHFTLGESPVRADSLSEFARAPWSYYAKVGAAAPVPLAMRDWQWTSFFGKPGLDPLTINTAWLSPAGDGAGPQRAIVRYTAPKAEEVELSACFTKKKAGDGVDVEVSSAGAMLYQGVVEERMVVPGLKVKLAAGQALDFAFGPNHTSGDDAVGYRIRLIQPGSGVVTACMP